MQILLPMAGRGNRFVEQGYEKPKPLIDVCGKPMIERVLENLGMSNEYVFLVQKEHFFKYSNEFLNVFNKTNSFKLVLVEGVTEGAACTALLAKSVINKKMPMAIANCDQLVTFQNHPSELCMYRDWQDGNYDNLIYTFKSRDTKHSYAQIDSETKFVTQVAEKLVISDNATVGIYVFGKASSFIGGAEEMIRRNIRTNNEFYIAPVFNILIERGEKTVLSTCVNHPIGTPEDLENYIKEENYAITRYPGH